MKYQTKKVSKAVLHREAWENLFNYYFLGILEFSIGISSESQERSQDYSNVP